MRKIIAFARKSNGSLMSAGTGTWAAYQAGTLTPVTVYNTDNTGDPVSSFAIPTSGKIEFYARNADIKLVATEGAETVTVDDISVIAGLIFGILSARPAAGSADRFYYATDVGRIYRDDGSAWKDFPDYSLDALDLYPADDITAAATTDVFAGKGNYQEVTHASGTVAITALANNDAPEGSPRFVKFTVTGGTLTITHNATSLDTGGVNITVATGDMFLVLGKGGSNVSLHRLQKPTAAYKEPQLLYSNTVGSAVASVDIGLGYTGFRHFLLEIDDVRPATDGATGLLRVSEDSGSTFKAGASDYEWSYIATASSSATSAVDRAQNDTSISVFLNGLDNGAGGSQGCVHFKLMNPAGNARHKHIFVDAQYVDNVAGTQRMQRGSGFYKGTVNPVNALRFLFSAGNIATGTFRLWGIP